MRDIIHDFIELLEFIRVSKKRRTIAITLTAVIGSIVLYDLIVVLNLLVSIGINNSLLFVQIITTTILTILLVYNAYLSNKIAEENKLSVMIESCKKDIYVLDVLSSELLMTKQYLNTENDRVAKIYYGKILSYNEDSWKDIPIELMTLVRGLIPFNLYFEGVIIENEPRNIHRDRFISKLEGLHSKADEVRKKYSKKLKELQSKV